jgi:UDP-N-acetylmuramoyl-L-alanyl-D-glutamate--2,6-diaminopimelate ligase
MAFEVLINDQSFGNIQSQLIGSFNVSNSLAVLATLMANEYTESEAIKEVTKLKPIVGRMELVRGKATQAPMAIVDFAHTPDALEQTLKALRPIANQRLGKLWCVFGCGGDRDSSKRPLMGGIAEQFADEVMVTSDNPRSEDPEKIITEILSGCKVVEKIQKNSDRATAILQVIRQARQEDVVLVAGKGHEETQEILGKRHAFSDQLHLQLAMGGAVV